MIPTIIGEAYLTSSKNYIKTGGDITYIMTNYACPGYGVITSFWAYFVNPGDTEFQIWRRTGSDAVIYKLVGSKRYRAKHANLQEVLIYYVYLRIIYSNRLYVYIRKNDLKKACLSVGFYRVYRTF